MKYDDASWHWGSKEWPKGLNHAHAYTHTGIFLTWLVLNDLVSPDFVEEISGEGEADMIKALKQRKITPGKFFEEVDGKLTDDMIHASAIPFVEVYYQARDCPYFRDYDDILGTGLPTLYHVPDSWESYDKISKKITERFESHKQGIEGVRGMNINKQMRFIRDFGRVYKERTEKELDVIFRIEESSVSGAVGYAEKALDPNWKKSREAKDVAIFVVNAVGCFLFLLLAASEGVMRYGESLEKQISLTLGEHGKRKAKIPVKEDRKNLRELIRLLKLGHEEYLNMMNDPKVDLAFMIKKNFPVEFSGEFDNRSLIQSYRTTIESAIKILEIRERCLLQG